MIRPEPNQAVPNQAVPNQAVPEVPLPSTPSSPSPFPFRFAPAGRPGNSAGPTSGVLVALGLALTLLPSCGAPPADGEGGPAGGIAAEAPDLTLLRADTGEPLSLREAGQDRVVLVDLWATWCVPCVAELPHLEELSTSFASEDFLMLGIVLESGDAEEVAEFVAEKGLTYPNVMGSNEARDSFGPFLGYPTKYLVGSDGRIVKRYFGPVGEVLNEEIGALITTGAID